MQLALLPTQRLLSTGYLQLSQSKIGKRLIPFWAFAGLHSALSLGYLFLVLVPFLDQIRYQPFRCPLTNIVQSGLGAVLLWMAVVLNCLFHLSPLKARTSPLLFPDPRPRFRIASSVLCRRSVHSTSVLSASWLQVDVVLATGAMLYGCPAAATVGLALARHSMRQNAIVARRCAP
jgi:hypothetical protein